MAAIDGLPDWFRGPDDPSGYRIRVCEDLRWMRNRAAKLTMREMAGALSRELRRHVPESSVTRWENGMKLAGSDVYRAYISISGSAYPTDVGAKDPRLLPVQRIQEMEQRIIRMERLVKVEPPHQTPSPDDLVTVAEAAELRTVSRQTIHNWLATGKIRTTNRGRKLLLSRTDVLAYES